MPRGARTTPSAEPLCGFEKHDQAGLVADDAALRLAYPPPVSKEAVARLCFGATFVIAAFSLGLQFVQDWLGVWDDPEVVGQPHAVRVWRFFSYFTTQANLLVVATSLGLARSPSRDGPGWRVVRLNALTGITITGLVHWFCCIRSTTSAVCSGPPTRWSTSSFQSLCCWAGLCSGRGGGLPPGLSSWG
jgi:hypothetical protein